MASAQKPAILLIALSQLSLVQDTCHNLISTLQAKSDLLQAELPTTALQHLSRTNLIGVILGDGDLTKGTKYADLLHAVLNYAKAGGRVVCCAGFSSFTRAPDVTTFFRNTWGLSWEPGTYERATYFANPGRGHGTAGKDISSGYSQKALSLKGVLGSDRLYVPTARSETESFGQVTRRVQDLSQTPTALANIGQGFLGYVGDVNSEEESIGVILAMLGLI